MSDYAQAAERAVIGDLLRAPSLVRKIAGIVTPDDFADPRLGYMLNLIAGLVSAHGPDAVTPTSVAEEAQHRAHEARNAPRKADQVGPRIMTIGELAELLTHGLPGTTEGHANVVRSGAMARRLATFGLRTMTDAETGADPAVLAARTVEQARAIRDGYRTSGLPLECLSDVLDDDTLGDYDWVIPGLLERNDRLIVTGGEGLGKSTFLRQIALCAAAGIHPFTAAPIPRQRVMVIDAENSRRQWNRKANVVNLAVSHLAGCRASDLVQLACVSRRDVTNARDLGDIHSAIDEHEPDMIVIGPLYKLVPTAVNNDTEAAPLINALDSIRERGVTLVMEAHAGKGTSMDGGRNFAPRGSSALLGWPEFGFGLAPDAEDPKIAHVLRWRGDRDERDWPTRLTRGGVMPWTDDRKEPAKVSRAFGLQEAD